mgnify:CR=1 FL=1
MAWRRSGSALDRARGWARTASEGGESVGRLLLFLGLTTQGSLRRKTWHGFWHAFSGAI